MALHRIQTEEIITYRGRRYRIGRRLDTGEFLLEPLEGERGPLTVALEKLETGYAKGELEFVPLFDAAAQGAAGKAWHRPVDLSQLPEDLREETNRRIAYVTAVREARIEVWDPEMVRPILDETAKRLGVTKPPHVNTVQDWNKKLYAGGEDLMSLVPRVSLRGNYRRRMSPEVIGLVAQAIQRYYLTRERKSGTDVWHMVIGEIDRANKTRSPDQQLKAPCRRTVYTEIKKLDAYAVCVARYGERYAERKFRQAGRYPRPKYPLERIEIDHTKADLMVVDDEMRLPIGRPWITAAIDVRTKMLFGLVIGFTPPSLVTAMACMRHGILPKHDLKERFPNIVNPWPVHGAPEWVTCDKGKEFLSPQFKEALGHFGTKVAECDRLNPDQKAPIERWLGTINRTLLQGQPGTAFSNIMDRDDYDPAKHAVVSLSVFEAIVFKWVCDVYHIGFHRGLCDVPLVVWERETKAHPPPGLPRRIDDLIVLFGRMEERSVTQSGIELMGLFFNAPELAEIRQRMGKRKAKVRIDEADLGQVHVYDELNRRYVRAPCVAPEYATGLNVWQHRVIRRYALRQGMDNQDLSALAAAKLEIQEMVEAEWKQTKKTGHRQRMARFLGGATGARIEVNNTGAPLPTVAAEPMPLLAADEAAEASLLKNLSDDDWGVEPRSTH